MHALSPLIVENLTVVRGDRRLFTGFSAHIEPGELVHLTGRNGVGKTSLLETLVGLRSPEQGVLRGVVPEQMHWLGHKNALHPALSAQENLEFWSGQAGAPPQAVGVCLQRLQLGRAAYRPVRGLSTGQKRRAALARLLLQVRPWWVLDEPLAGLDAEGLQLFAQLVIEHRQGGGGVLLTSHQALPAACGSPRHWTLQ